MVTTNELGCLLAQHCDLDARLDVLLADLGLTSEGAPALVSLAVAMAR